MKVKFKVRFTYGVKFYFGYLDLGYLINFGLKIKVFYLIHLS